MRFVQNASAFHVQSPKKTEIPQRYLAESEGRSFKDCPPSSPPKSELCTTKDDDDDNRAKSIENEWRVLLSSNEKRLQSFVATNK